LTDVDGNGHHGRVPTVLPLLDTPSATAPCCAPLAVAPMSEFDAERLAVRLKAVADPARLRLLSMLMASPGGEGCTCELTEPLGLSQPTVTHHLRKLAEAGLVSGERRGKWTYYRAHPEALAGIAAVLLPPAVLA
jgi:ArsR family transcriptional regulator